MRRSNRGGSGRGAQGARAAGFTIVAWATLLLATGAGTAGAQQAPAGGSAAGAGAGAGALAAADSAMRACEAAANAKDADESAAGKAADRAEAAYTQAGLSGAPLADVLTGRASVLSRCRIPLANMFRKGELAEESSELARRAIAADSMHLGARFLLAMNDYYMPEFLGRTDAATQEMEWVVEHYGVRAGPGYGPLAYLCLGDLYVRGGRKADAAATWRKGAALFPARAAEFSGRLEKIGASGSGGGGEATTGRRDDAIMGAASAAPATSGTRETPATTSPMEGASPTAAAPKAVALAPLVVQASSFSLDAPRSGTALKRMDVLTMPGGMADVLQVFQMVPGSTRVTEGSDLYVRGGDASEAPVLVDGARLPYAGAFESLDGGITGVLEASVLKNAVFSSGAFSARYGNALSGILDVQTEGRPGAPDAHGGLNLVSATGVVKRPLGRLGAWAAGKAMETSALLWTQGRGGEYPLAPREAQGMAALVAAPRPGVELRAEVLGAGDQAVASARALDYQGDLHMSGKTALGLVAARALSTDGTRSIRAVASGSLRSTGLALGLLDRDRTDRAAALRLDADLAPSSALRLRAGAEAQALDARESGRVPTSPSLVAGAPSELLPGDVLGTGQLGGFAEAELRATDALALTVGARADRLPGEDAWTADPRAAVALRAGEWTLRAGAGLFHQGRWRTGYRLPDAGSPSGVPTRATHAVLGAERGGRLALRAEAFLKRYDRYVAPSALPSEWMAQTTAGPPARAGHAAGVDALARWTGSGRLTGWVSWSLLHSTQELVDGRTVRSPVDVTHSLTGVARLAVASAWELGTTLRYGTGRPYTPILGAAPADGQEGAAGPLQPVYGAPDGARMPDYFRADARVTWLASAHGRSVASYLEMLNLLDRRNVAGYSYDASYRNPRPVGSFFAHRTLVLGLDVQL